MRPFGWPRIWDRIHTRHVSNILVHYISHFIPQIIQEFSYVFRQIDLRIASDRRSWCHSHRRSSHFDRVHQGIGNPKARILFQEAFGNLLYERHCMLRQRFDHVEKLWRDDDNGMMSGWDGEGRVFELKGRCQACDHPRQGMSFTI